jgi:hypothetical protein
MVSHFFMRKQIHIKHTFQKPIGQSLKSDNYFFGRHKKPAALSGSTGFLGIGGGGGD